jgi:hypothetical protein
MLSIFDGIIDDPTQGFTSLGSTTPLATSDWLSALPLADAETLWALPLVGPVAVAAEGILGT